MDWYSLYVVAGRLFTTPWALAFAPRRWRRLWARASRRYSTPTRRGSQFTSWGFTQVLQNRGVRTRMDGKGRYQDNIFVERLWQTVK